MNFAARNPCHQYELNKTELRKTQTVKDLRIWLSNSLNISEQVDNVVNIYVS